ncbi:MAG TPA: ABC transporter ATP-binding protein [Candidatus Lokiarchaeia archaeon]|nr:ABC transporter ATP-binding protein [Candidatus Lokiarchaeia archaeon]
MSQQTIPAIECTGVTKTFGSTAALNKITFSIAQSSTMCIAGANGAGKTTLLKILAGIMKPTTGVIKIDGLTYNDAQQSINQSIGVLLDESFLYADLDLRENLRYYSKLHGIFNDKEIMEKIEKLSDIFDLHEWLDEPVRNLSKGMRKKGDIIRFLLHEPSILFLDEPFSALDQNSVNKLLEMFSKLKFTLQATIIFSTHELETAVPACDEMMILKRGRISNILKKGEFSAENVKEYM